MKEFNYKITDALGIHARPAGLLVKLATNFASDIKLCAKGKEVDAKRIMAVMGLGVKAGDTMRVIANGEDESSAISELQKFCNETL